MHLRDSNPQPYGAEGTTYCASWLLNLFITQETKDITRNLQNEQRDVSIDES